MKNAFISLLVSLLFTPGMVSAANPFINISDQLDQLNSEVTELDDRVTTNATSINNLRSVNVYVDGVKRGAMMEPLGGNFINASAIRLLLESEYIALLSTGGGGLREVSLSYQTNDCSGQSYLAIGNMNPVAARQGIVMRNDAPASNTLYYAPSGSVVESISIESQTVGGICNDIPTTSSDAVQVIYNDSTLTGVVPSDFVGEVTIGF